MTGLLWLAILCAGAPPAPASPNPEPVAKAPSPDSLQRGLDYLARAQADDGGWHSETYGALRPGAATTALVLHAIASAPRPLRDLHRARCLAAYRFLTRSPGQQKYVCNPDGSADYPTYATALTLAAARRLGIEDKPLHDRYVQYLLRMQLDERQKFSPDSPHYGGWDLMGPDEQREITSGTNVSITRYVLAALEPVDTDAARQARARARDWAKRCQNMTPDGGFPFTPDSFSASNKAGNDAGVEADQPRSYGTATCDGLLCLATAGPPNDAEVRRAIQWISKNFEAEQPPGFLADDDQGPGAWRRGLRFYYFAAVAETLPLLPTEPENRSRLADHIRSLQKDDGRWENDAAQMREDDPLIATALAVIALSHLANGKQSDE
ncbi:prenyltransferase/squalene oxidase repeat-containing protein [Lignipirellula cremea]|uniref:Prenyltransferase alpha-alpha toroid domain-containing protein n=1 Tax=Lignipirellula cremea TaxID=2528010 RepID=A0A518DSW9_9BACT|nr:hypothetical protein [Lignipirellula cremea]QDU94935.1 hypothetical protein Pla8534_27430 [Lignipirellula cremea]